MHQLSVSHIQKSYGKKQVLYDISLQVKSGEIVGLLGPNGAGKTTLFYIICGLLKASKGRITINDQDITKLSFFKRAHTGIGYLPQEVSIFQDLSVEENIELSAQIAIKDKKKRADKIEEVLELFSIEAIRRMPADKLSGGERRRVEIARILVGTPDFLLFDEPFAGVDPISVTDIMGLVKTLCKKNIGMLITDHSAKDILNLCDRIYVIQGGIVLVSGNKDEIMAHEMVKQTYLGKDFSL